MLISRLPPFVGNAMLPLQEAIRSGRNRLRQRSRYRCGYDEEGYDASHDHYRADPDSHPTARIAEARADDGRGARRPPARDVMNYNAGFLSEDALRALGFRSLGQNVLVHQTVVLVGCGNIGLGDNVRIDPFCLLSVSGGLCIGRNVHLGSHCSLTGSAPVTIDDFAGFSHGVRIFSANDDYSGATMTNPTVPSALRKVDAAPVTIGRHVIVGSNSVILPGSTINEGAAVGALCVVRGSLDAWKMYVGPSARAIRDRSRELLALEATYLEAESQKTQ